MGSRSASGEDEPLSSPLWQRAKVFYPHLFCYPVSITNTQIKWLWKLTKQWKYIKPKKPAPYREVLNRTFCHGKTKLCFIPVNTTGSRRIWTAMSSSDISPETSGCRTSALWYFPSGSKLLSEVFHLFIIFFVDWEKRDGIHIFVHGSTGELCCTGGYRMKPREIYPAGTSHCFTHISTRSHLGRRVHSPAQQTKPWAAQSLHTQDWHPPWNLSQTQRWCNQPTFADTRGPMSPCGPHLPNTSVWFSRLLSKRHVLISNNAMGESGCLKSQKFFLASWTLKVSRSHFILGWAKEKLVICLEPNSLLLFLILMLLQNEMLVR